MKKDSYMDGFGNVAKSINATETDGMMLLRLPPALIEPDPAQPRKHFDEQKLAELAESIRRHGQLQPIRIRRADQGPTYIIVAGERRWRACTLLGLETIDAVLLAERDGGDLVREAQLVENLQRADLSPMETAIAYRAEIERLGCSQAELARRLGVSTATVSRTLALLEAPEDVREKVARGESVRRATGAATRRKVAPAKPDKRRAVELELSSGSVRVKRGYTLEQFVDELVAHVAEQKRTAA